MEIDPHSGHSNGASGSAGRPAAAPVVAGDKEQMYSNVVRVLSDTLNSTMQEFGYFPGLPHAFTDLRTETVTLREQNAKLISDNTALSRMTFQQNEHIKKLSEQITMTDNSAIVQGLQHQIHQLKTDRETILHTQQQYVHENRFLHIELEKLTGGSWHQRMNLIPPSRLMGTKPSGAGNTSGPAPPSAPPPIPQQTRIDELQQTFVSNQNRAPVPLQAQINEPQPHGRVKRPSLALIPMSNQVPGPNSAQSIHMPTTSAVPFNAWKHYDIVKNGSHPLPAPGQSRSPVSASPTYIQPRPPSTLSSFVVPAGSSLSRPPSAPRPSSAPRPPSAPRSPFVARPSSAQRMVSQPHFPGPRRVSTSVIDLTADDDTAHGPVFDDPRALKRRRTEDQAPASSHMDMQSMNTEISTLQQEIKPPPSIPAPEVLLPIGWHSDQPAPMPPLLSGSVVTAEPEPMNVEPEVAVEAVVVTETATDNVETLNGLHADTTEEAEEEEEEDDDEPGDMWDENGMIKIEVCLDAAFEDADDKMICKMCEYRARSIGGQAPGPMTDTSQSALIKHCEEEHPVGWAMLRDRKRPEQEPESNGQGEAAVGDNTAV